MKMLLTLYDVAEMAGITYQTARGAVIDGRIPAFKIGNRWKVKKEDAERFVMNLSVPAPSTVGVETLLKMDFSQHDRTMTGIRVKPLDFQKKELEEEGFEYWLAETPFLDYEVHEKNGRWAAIANTADDAEVIDDCSSREVAFSMCAAHFLKAICQCFVWAKGHKDLWVESQHPKKSKSIGELCDEFGIPREYVRASRPDYADVKGSAWGCT